MRKTKTLDQYQKEINELFDKFGFDWSNYVHLSRLVEEVGELAEALTVHEGDRKSGSGTSALAAHPDLKEEIGDVFCCLARIAEKTGVNLSDAIEYNLKRYEKKLKNNKNEQG